jgi:putative peptidoglycan lipid II flippase
MRERSLLYYFLKSSSGIMTSRILGLIRDLVVAAVFGANKITDAFFVAFAIPNLFRALFAEGALSSAYIPILAEKYRRNYLEALKYLTQLILIVGVTVVVIIFIICIFPREILIVFMPGYAKDLELLNAASQMLGFLMPYLFFVMLVAIITGYLNLMGSYFVSYSSTAILNIFMIMGAFLGYRYGRDIIYLAYGVFLGGLFQFLYVFLYSKLRGFTFVPSFQMDPDIKKTFLLIVPSIAGLGISQINFVVGRVFASFLSSGSISYLYYANRLFQFPLGVFSVALGSVSLTEMSKAIACGDSEKARYVIDKSIISLLFIMLPATAGLLSLSYEITSLIYKRSSFGEFDTIYTAEALRMYAVGLLFYSLVGLFTRVFYSKKDTATPVKIAFLMSVLNVGLNYPLMLVLKHAGIALASSIVAMVNAFLLYKKITDYRFSFYLHRETLVKICAGTLFMLLFIYIQKIADVHLLINILVSTAVYFVSMGLMGLKIREILK